MQGWLILSGLLAGVAVTQKVSAVFFWPWAGLMLVALATHEVWKQGWSWGAVRRQAKVDGLRLTTDVIRVGLVWGVALVLGVLLVWPAVWANPVGTALGVIAKAADEGGNPHQAGQFVGEEIVDDPGPLMYALALAFRASPWMLLGLGLALWLLIRRPNAAVKTATGEPLADRPPSRTKDPTSTAVDDRRDAPLPRFQSAGLALVACALLFALLISISPKKFDRYLLPIFPVLDLVAGLGLVALTRRLRLVQGGVVAALLLTQLALALPHAPYYLTYYNPLLGGGATATRWLLVGWGEGYDQAAAYLNSLPNAQDTQVAVRGVSQFAPIFVGETRSAPGYRPYQTDYVVFYANEVQRRRNEGLLQRFLDNPNEKPVHVVRMQGIDYAWIYPNTTATQPLTYLRQGIQPGDALVVNGASLAAKGAPVGLPQAKIFGHFNPTEIAQALATLPPATRLWYLRYPEADPGAVLDVVREQTILEGEPRKFPDVEVWQGRIPPPASIAVGVESEGVRLTAWSASNYFPTPGKQEALALSWQVQRPVRGDVSLSLELLDTTGAVVTRVEKPLRASDLRPTSRWRVGEQINTLVPLTIPPGTPPGGYAPRLRLRRGDETLRWEQREVVALDPLTVGRMLTPLALDKQTIRSRFLGDTGLALQLVGHDLAPQWVQPGMNIDVPLWWYVRGSISPLNVQTSVWDVRGLSGPVSERTLISPEQANNDWRAGDIYRVIGRAVVSPDAPTGPAQVEVATRRADGTVIPFDYHFFEPIWVRGRPLTELPQRPQTLVDYELDGAARLVGYDVSQSYPNNPVKVTLYWRVTQPASLPFSTFVHLLKPNGDILTQVDRAAGLGFYPPNAWRSGEIVVDPYTLPLPFPTEPGRYRLALGWYTPAGRATVRDGSGQPIPDNRIVIEVDIR